MTLAEAYVAVWRLQFAATWGAIGMLASARPEPQLRLAVGAR